MPRYFPDVSYFLFPHIGHESPSGRVLWWESIWVSTFTYFCLFGSSLKTKNLKIYAWIQGQNINNIPGQPLEMDLCKVVYLTMHIRLTIRCHWNIHSPIPQADSELHFSQFPSIFLFLSVTQNLLLCHVLLRPVKPRIDYNDKNLHFLICNYIWNVPPQEQL